MSITRARKQRNSWIFDWVVNADISLRFRYVNGILCPLKAENSHFSKWNSKRWVEAFRVSENLMSEIAEQCGKRFSRIASSKLEDKYWQEHFDELDECKKNPKPAQP